MSVPVPEHKCPYCSHALNRVSIPGPDPVPEPEPGDATVCINCSAVLVFGPDLTVHKPTDEEIVDLAGSPSLLEAMRFVGEYQKMKYGKP